MARTPTNAPDKVVAPEPETSTPQAPEAAPGSGNLSADAGEAGDQVGIPPAESEASADAASAGSDETALEDLSSKGGKTAEITIYPLRSYLDGQEVRRAGGAGYKSPKHDAVSLIAAGLATDKNPKA